MLPKQRKLSREEISEVKKQGRRKSCGDFLLSVLSVPEHKGFKATVVVSKKVAAKAVARNAIRRALYRALAAYVQNGPKRLYLSVVALQSAKGKEPALLEKGLADCLKNL